jgi:hypothetical protein
MLYVVRGACWSRAENAFEIVIQIENPQQPRYVVLHKFCRIMTGIHGKVDICIDYS